MLRSKLCSVCIKTVFKFFRPFHWTSSLAQSKRLILAWVKNRWQSSEWLIDANICHSHDRSADASFLWSCSFDLVQFAKNKCVWFQMGSSCGSVRFRKKCDLRLRVDRILKSKKSKRARLICGGLRMESRLLRLFHCHWEGPSRFF